MSELGSLRAQKQRKGKRGATGASDGVRNTGNNGGGPSNRSPFGPDRPPQLGPNGAGRPQGGGGGVGWLPRLFLLVLVLVVAYNLYVWLGPNNSSSTIQFKYSDFVVQVDAGNVMQVTITNHTDITGTLRSNDTYGGVTSNQ